MDIAVITREFSPLTRNGGIGTAMRFLCEALATAGGHRVTIYYTGRPYLRLWSFAREMRRSGLIFRPVIAPLGLILHDQLRRSRAVWRALSGTLHDVCLFHEFMADGWFFLQNRRPGTPPCCMVTHGSALWVDEGNGHVATGGSRAAIYKMERECCEQADFLVSPSHYLLNWMLGHGWRLPCNARVIPNFTSALASTPPQCPRKSATLSEIVFFGRLEERKGVRVFCDALLRLPPELLAGRQVTFLGREGGYTSDQMRAWLAPLTQAGMRLVFLSGLDAGQARAYLCSGGRLAVMPSLRENSPCVISECLESGIPFLASSSGGGPELVCPEDRSSSFVPPDAAELATRLASIFMDGCPPVARASHTQAELVIQWNNLLTGVAGQT